MSAKAVLFFEIIAGILSVAQCNYCPPEHYPYTNGISCLQFTIDNHVDYQSAMGYTAPISYALPISTSLVSSRNFTLDLKILLTFASSIFNETNPPIPLWVGDCFNQCNDSSVNPMTSGSCPALFNGSIIPMNCSLKLGYILQTSFITASQIYHEPVFGNVNSQLTFDLDSPFNQSNYTVSWTLNDHKLNPQYFTVLNNNSLYISTIMEDFYGIYTATVSNGFNQAAVIFSADLQQAVFIPPEASNISIPTGHLAVFKCTSLNSRPNPEVVWYNKFMQQISNGGRYLVSSLGTLYIREVTLDDSGVYYCSLSNIAGEAQIAMQLDVIDETINKTTLLTQFILSPVNQTILRDEVATLECAVMSNHVITIGQINSVTNYLFEADGSFIDTVVYLPFSVSNTFPSINYKTTESTLVRCRAQITVSNIGTQNIVSGYATIMPNVRASVSSISESASIELGKPVSLTCSFEGTPSPVVKWYFNGKPIYNSTTPSNHDSSYLEIKEFSLSNVGTYQCMVTNIHSIALSPVILTPKDGIPEMVSFNVTLMEDEVVIVTWDTPSNTNTLSPKLLRYIVYWKISGHMMGQVVTVPYNQFMYSIMIDQHLIRGQTYEITVFAYSTAEQHGPVEFKEVFIPYISKPTQLSTSSISRTIVVTSSSDSITTTSNKHFTTSTSSLVTIAPTIGAITPGSVSMQTIILTTVLSIALFLLSAVSICFVAQCVWWRKRGTKGNYSPEKIEEQIERAAMMSVVSKPIVPPSPVTSPPPTMSSSSNMVRSLLASTSDSVAADSISQLSVEVIRVDSLYSSRDDLCDKTTNTQSKL